MAANPTDVVSVQLCLTAMRYVGAPGTVDDVLHRKLIATYLADAVQWVNRLTQIGILDTPLARECSVASLTAPLLIRHRSQQIKRFQFRAADATDAPCDLADADMLTPCGLGETRVDPPLDGWPATTLHVQYALSTDADATPGGIRNAVIHLTRDMYDMRGGERQGASRTVLDWIAQYRPKAPDEDAVTGVPMPVTLPGSSSVVTLRAGWSTDAAATADELVGQSTGTVITTPAATDPAPHQYLALWRSDVAEATRRTSSAGSTNAASSAPRRRSPRQTPRRGKSSCRTRRSTWCCFRARRGA